MIVVDTSIWSEVLRKSYQPNPALNNTMTRLILGQLAVLLGPIRQELLSGIKDLKVFEKLRSDLSAFPDPELEKEDFELAAQYFNKCRAKGIQGSNTDFFICAFSTRRKFQIFTNDKDFSHYAKILPIKLFHPG